MYQQQLIQNPFGITVFGSSLIKVEPDSDSHQELLGHKKLETTLIYTHVLDGAAVKSPSDRLPMARQPINKRMLIES